MTAAFTERDWERIERAAWDHFVSSPAMSLGASRRVKFREKRSVQLLTTCIQFRKQMESDSPPETREEAIRRIVGVLGTLLAIVFPQYALLIQIISFLWDATTGTQSTISGVAMGASEGRV